MRDYAQNEHSSRTRGQQLVWAITRASAERLGLAEGKPVTIFIKATEVLLGVDET